MVVRLPSSYALHIELNCCCCYRSTEALLVVAISVQVKAKLRHVIESPKTLRPCDSYFHCAALQIKVNQRG